MACRAARELLIQATGGQAYSFIPDSTTGQPLNMETPSGRVGLYLYDGTGNPVGILTDSGTRGYAASFAPYGAQTVTDGGSSDWFSSTPYGFKSGTRTDGDALVKFGLRWYLPSTGTWAQRDTLDAPLDPSNANRYAYAGDDPLNNSDPSGQLSAYQCKGLNTVLDGYIAVGGVAALGGALFAETGVGAAVAVGGLTLLAEGGVGKFALDFFC